MAEILLVKEFNIHAEFFFLIHSCSFFNHFIAYDILYLSSVGTEQSIAMVTKLF